MLVQMRAHALDEVPQEDDRRLAVRVHRGRRRVRERGEEFGPAARGRLRDDVRGVRERSELCGALRRRERGEDAATHARSRVLVQRAPVLPRRGGQEHRREVPLRGTRLGGGERGGEREDDAGVLRRRGDDALRVRACLRGGVRRRQRRERGREGWRRHAERRRRASRDWRRFIPRESRTPLREIESLDVRPAGSRRCLKRTSHVN
eukprot:29989-Pelagococcus_subviridis.AAC.9